MSDFFSDDLSDVEIIGFDDYPRRASLLAASSGSGLASLGSVSGSLPVTARLSRQQLRALARKSKKGRGRGA